ncbi:Os1348 family NHLP clan protein [Amycolatopsis solani]|uniref:Os1348 family NHLP clan protein n=1 Tax=Amycolatopsis solani TaxID=3028615 RepID=UPI0025B08B6C|nr:Os1348 family NHLP clan protein [Amycolatopsis sp. MEP2-6]
MPNSTDAYTAEQIAEAVKVAQIMDAVVGRLTYDKEFAAALANNPSEALANAGLRMEKEAVEVLMATDPERFDRSCEALFDLVDSDFLHKLVMPSCGPSLVPEHQYDVA